MTENTSLLNAPPDQKLLEAIAADLGVDPSFVEKDWHAMRLVAVLAGVEYGELRPVISGGTSLSKAYDLIRRFSEDLDFKMILPEGGIDRAARREYRCMVIDAIRGAGDWSIEDSTIRPGNQSRFFSCLIEYPAGFAPAPSLRPQVRLEITISPPALPPEERPLRSFVSEARREYPEVRAISCIAPTETAADKLSILTWRVLTRQRGTEGDDPTLIRHLHDLAALEIHAAEDAAFPELSHKLIARDAASRGRASPAIAEMTPAECVTAALETLARDPDYPREYERFVLNMSYAAEGETPGFDAALAAARRLGDRLP